MRPIRRRPQARKYKIVLASSLSICDSIKTPIMKWIRKPCPLCSSRTGFALDSESGGFICHACKAQGHISQIDGGEFKVVPRQEQAPKQIIDPIAVWESLRPAVERGPTDQYLRTRGIFYPAWADLGLREGKYFDQTIKAVYPFKDMYGEIKALHRTFHRNGIKEKKYIGPKSKGVAMLSTIEPIIIAEGLENALIIRQHFTEQRRLPFGLCVGGDSGNIIKYVIDHKIIMGKHKYIYVWDRDLAGVNAAKRFCRSYNVVENVKTTIYGDAIDLYSSKDAQHGSRDKG